MLGYLSKKLFIGKVFLLVIMQSFMTACSSYHSSFSCPEARGGRCLPIDKIDSLISSGEIEEIIGIDDECFKGKCSLRKKRKLITQKREFPIIKDQEQEKNIYFPEEMENEKK
ncbi:MAG: hypothetical protein KA998_00165 [Rickettsiaceae bacterium]|nr:hypothetical protein [Rickettsiaceae bacterium]